MNGKAGDYLSMDRFNYGYDRAGTGENLIGTPKLVAEAAAPVAAAKIAGNGTSVELPAAILPQGRTAVEIPRPLMAQVTLRRPAETRQRSSLRWSRLSPTARRERGWSGR